MILLTDIIACHAGLAYLLEKEVLPTQYYIKTSVYVLCSKIVSGICQGVALRQLVDPLYPSYFLDRKRMVFKVMWFSLFIGVFIQYVVQEQYFHLGD